MDRATVIRDERAVIEQRGALRSTQRTAEDHEWREKDDSDEHQESTDGNLEGRHVHAVVEHVVRPPGRVDRGEREDRECECGRHRLEETEPSDAVGMRRHEREGQRGKPLEEHEREDDSPEPRERERKVDRPGHVQIPPAAETDAAGTPLTTRP